MKSRIWFVFYALVIATSPALLTATAASAASAGTTVCGDPGPAALLLSQDAAGLAQPDSQVVAATAEYKAQHDTEAAAVRAAAGKWAADDARKQAMVSAAQASQRGSATVLSSPAQVRQCANGQQVVSPDSYTSGSGFAWVDNLQQQGQQRNYWCGPATVSEMAWTVPGPSNVNQANAASYMGTTTDGTGVDAMTGGLVHFVGIPDYGWNFYSFVWMDYNPTASQRSTFLSNLQTDVILSSPVAGDAWEAAGGPHLLHHPTNQTIFHWFEIGGWSTNTSQVYYADSATTVWTAVQPYNWQDLYTVETILGGRGYVW